MARIRSIHPGLTSDEAYMSMSMTAKAAWTPLWMQCDDHGIFEWKPIVLKALVFPADNVDFAAVLDELLKLGCVRKLDINGKPHGVVRNFAKYQRPKNPSYRHFKSEELPTDIGNFIAIKGIAAPALPQSSPSATEIPPQRKEEGGIGSGEERAREPSKSLISEEAFQTSAHVLDAMGLDREHPLSVGAPLTIQGWFNEHWNAECIVIGVKRGMQSRKGDPPTTLKYFEKAIARAHAELTPALPTVQIRQAETITVTHGRNEKSGQISAAGSKLVESLKRGFGGASSESYLGSGEGDADAGLLAYRGGQ